MVSKSTVKSPRTRESPANHSSRSRSKSRPKESAIPPRSKSRPKEGHTESNGRPTGSDKPRDKSRSRSKSRPRQSSKPQAEGRPSPSRQQSKKSQKNRDNSSNTKSRSQTKKQPSSKKRQKFLDNAQKAIPASVRMISGSHDSQTSADVSNISSQFKLPNPAGRSGGACTAALLQVLYQSHEHGRDDICWVDVLRQMREVLEDKGFEQIPQLTSSRMIDVHDPFVITPTDGSFNHKNNTQRAVLIGINYTGQSGQLSGCHNDVHNVAKYLTQVQGFRKENVTILMDDGVHKNPTKSAIMSAYKRLVKESKEGDVVFCHYSGHGGRLPDDNGDEEDGYDETLIPVDFNKNGQIRDDNLLKILVHPMPAGVTMTCLMDCCHSGTVLDLPYRFTADGDLEEMEMNERCNFKDGLWSGMGLAMGMAAGNAVAGAVASVVAPEPAPEMLILGGGPNAIHEYSDTGCCLVQ
eukprot:CAMPEP_0181120302 /NCGR_PEP_ID=MMETSP1071-20121207/24082_1 /TAXON_ID=35127 /ORGANISM="Thalassiosira sp., Strain NH16" /LENGTH=464 /DNA_ID=CAMNT_0023204945 /DNA_START=132 /DNA_END=1529 /DNA_ORIENTATION=+